MNEHPQSRPPRVRKPNSNKIKPVGSAKTRGAAIRAQRRNQDDANRIVNQYADATRKPRERANVIVDAFDKLKVSFLGGLDDVGEKNMAIIEYQNDAIVLDCGNNLGVDLPGVNYEINDTAYLETIKHKLKGYVITHGHLDHMGGLRHTVSKFPAPIYGSRYTMGVIEKSFNDEASETGDDFKPELVIMNADTHEQQKIGVFMVEFIRVTHSLPDATAVSIDTPVGRIVATGDFRLDPEPLDRMPTDTARLRELGDKGVLLLLSESSYADVAGRVPTESTLQQSFHDLIGNAPGRIFVAAFSSNMNRTQMIINAAVAAGRKVALDGRGMLSYAEIAVRQGILKVPKGTIVAIQQAATIPAQQLLIMCTGGQGEPNAALQRMSEGQHKHVNLDAGDTVVISSSPIPGNEIRYDQLSNRLSRKGVHLYRHPTHELDGCGPLHVSGHAKRDELREMLQLIRPKFLVPVHGGALRRRYHAELAIEEGWRRKNTLLLDNGDCVFLTADSAELGGQVPHGSLLVDQNGKVVSGLVVKDRLMLSEEGIMAVIVTIDKKSGQLLTSPDIISRGFIAMRDNETLMHDFRAELRRAVQQRFRRVDIDRFKIEMREFITHYLFERTGRSPIVIPVVNVIGGKVEAQTTHATRLPSAADHAQNEQKRFQAMRARLLGQDQRD
jgi:ribonuclease J